MRGIVTRTRGLLAVAVLTLCVGVGGVATAHVDHVHQHALADNQGPASDRN